MLDMVNIVGTRNVVHAALSRGVRRLVYTSSIHALRRIPHGTTIDETTPFDSEGAISAYDHSKVPGAVRRVRLRRTMKRRCQMAASPGQNNPHPRPAVCAAHHPGSAVFWHRIII